jgi:hypothetical protein
MGSGTAFEMTTPFWSAAVHETVDEFTGFKFARAKPV